MKKFLKTIKYDYLQRTRSYAFLITLCISLAIAYTFVPSPNASYSTVKIGDYIGNYNSAWFGYVTAMMTSVFLSLIGFYLINNSISTDNHTKIGQVIASTKFTNLKYLLSKVISNFLVLFTITIVIFTMSVILFFLYSEHYNFELFTFIKPYLIITLPSLFFIAVIAVVFEVLLTRYSVIQNITFFFLFGALMTLNIQNGNHFNYDIFGGKIVTSKMEKQVQEIALENDDTGLSIGFSMGNKETYKKFEFTGVNFPTSFIISRFLWMIFSLLLIVFISPFFHRFNIKERIVVKLKPIKMIAKSNHKISLLNLPKLVTNYSILLLIKTELLLLFRNGKKWLWLLNVIGMVLLFVLPIKIAHTFVLPVLWFLQVSRLANLTTKEITNKVHYFAFSSYKPLSRLLFSQLLAGIILMLFLALPLVFRLGFTNQFSAVITVVLGSIFIVLLAATFGVITRSKKLFEVLFFMITYVVINGISFFDYFGSFAQNYIYIIKLFTFIISLVIISFLLRKYELDKL